MSTSKYRYVSVSALLLVATGCAWLPRSTDITLDAATYRAETDRCFIRPNIFVSIRMRALQT